MVWIHPVVQLLATFVGVYAAYLGLERFLSQHMGKATGFLWKRHVLFGRTALVVWMLGMAGGLLVARLKWQVNFVTGSHWQMAFVMLPLMVFGAATGAYMDKNKAKRTVLPLLHGGCNLLVLALAINQVRTGWQVIKDFIL